MKFEYSSIRVAHFLPYQQTIHPISGAESVPGNSTAMGDSGASGPVNWFELRPGGE